MTLMHPIQPPRATQDAANQNHWTYGQKIMDQNYVQLYGHDLCALVSACLMHKPIDRPSLQQLRHTLDDVLGPPVLTAQDQAWLRRWLHYPSRPNARPCKQLPHTNLNLSRENICHPWSVLIYASTSLFFFGQTVILPPHLREASSLVF